MFGITRAHEAALLEARPQISLAAECLVAEFHDAQVKVPEIALTIGDADTLRRLHSAQKRYVLDLFSGVYDLDYVNNRFRIGMVHKRIGVPPALYISAVASLKQTIVRFLKPSEFLSEAIDRLLDFDVSLVFDAYIRALVSAVETSREVTERCAAQLEQKVAERTRELELLSRTDPLTGLLNVRGLHEALIRAIRAAERRNEPVSFAYLDLNDFKSVNDRMGH